MLLWAFKFFLASLMQVAGTTVGDPPATTPAPLAPPAPTPTPGIAPEEHMRVLVDNAILKARIAYPQIPEDLLRKFKGDKPDDWLAFAEFAAKSIPVVPPQPVVPVAPAPAAVLPPGGEPVPAPGVGGTVSPQAISDMRRKDLRQKVLRKTATQEESYELADTTLIAAFNEHMKKTRLR